MLLTKSTSSASGIALSAFGMLLKRESCSDSTGACDNNNLTACIESFCTNCAYIVPAFSQCCAAPDYLAMADCLEKASQGGIAGVGAENSLLGSITPSAALLPVTQTASSPDFRACEQFNSVFDRCENATPGFSTLRPFTSQASCLCYSSSSYQGFVYDGYYSSCLEYFSTADTVAYSSIASLANHNITSSPCSAALRASVGPSGAASTPLSSSFQPTSTGQGNGLGLLTGDSSPAQTVAPTVVSSTRTGISPSPSLSLADGNGRISVSDPLCGKSQ